MISRASLLRGCSRGLGRDFEQGIYRGADKSQAKCVRRTERSVMVPPCCVGAQIVATVAFSQTTIMMEPTQGKSREAT